MKRLRIIITGKVQGVFYRDFALREAQKMDLVGYVKNTNDGTVEIVAEAEEKNLDKFLASCKKGPLTAFVTGVDVKEEPLTEEFEDFNVRY